MENIVDVIHTMSEGRMLDTMEKLYIYKETEIDDQINEKCTVKPNVIFEKLIVEDTDRAHITLITTRSSAPTSVTSSGHTQTQTRKPSCEFKS